ncbi:MAG: hypothetical protein LBI67_06260 [Treponema sp.]|jgi:hypothetical protein|nr:hypothetical protein [Treponema sp.]
MKVQFSFFRLSLISRFIISALCYAASAVVQSVSVPGAAPLYLPRLFALALCALPIPFLAAKNFSNKPFDLGKEEWKPVTMKEIDRLSGRMRIIKKIRIGAFYGTSFALTGTVFLFFIAIFLSPLMGAGVFFFSIELFLFFIPLFWFARIDKWYPVQLSERLSVFAAVFEYPFEAAYKVVPLLRFDEDRLGRKIPEDIRIMLEPVKKPADLVGVQFQITMNKGPNGEVPYVYAVFITKDRASLRKTIVGKHFPGFVTELSTDPSDEFGTAVLRLNTGSRSDGYHTKSADIKKLVRNVLDVLPDLH